ncbi:MAG: Gfo/Idh/MocA family oxidoreductase [candidate division Zixibacteria bacterium]|nr:Gfo/Idh/MocA family oxidoreductase [candidate division Zixibacteria bacterium]MDH3938300.1 Gfo/Idh/MocA family oxidoreductase [candidate division Zixibacteria bacterium]MDH4035737.1 Gfo/Idh/MocA family oxidoreductase [candidate division Zixibacteria bacterium]
MKVGVIGCGYWGPNLIRNFNALDDVEVAAVCDGRSERLDFIHRQFPAIKTLTGEADDILKATDIDAVIIATPVSAHYPLGMEALANGKHLFMEKPFTATTEQAESLINLGEQKNLQIMVDHTFIYTGAVQTIKRFIDDGELGELFYFDSVRVNLGLFQHDVNVIWDLAPHDVSIMDYLIDRPPIAIAATGVAHFENGIENIAYISTYYEGNLLGHIHVNWLAPVKVRKTLVSGSRKMVIYDDTEPSEKVKVYDSGVEIVEDKNAIYDLLVQYRTGDMLAPKLDSTEALKLVSSEFYNAVNENRAPRTDGRAGLRVVRILEAANRSIRDNGRVVELS